MQRATEIKACLEYLMCIKSEMAPCRHSLVVGTLTPITIGSTRAQALFTLLVDILASQCVGLPKI